MFSDLRGAFKWPTGMQPTLPKGHIPFKVDCYIKAGRVNACVSDLRGKGTQCPFTTSAISAT